MPVEFYDKSGGPEDPKFLEIKGLVDREWIEGKKKEHPEFEALLAQIDFGWMKKAFQGALTKSGVDPDKINFVEPELIAIDNSMDNTAQYSVDHNWIIVNMDRLIAAQGFKYSPDVFLRSLIRVLLHEEGHAISRNICIGFFDYDEEGRRKVSARSGYDQHELDLKENEAEEHIRRYNLFDEGVNEKMSRELMIEYLRSHPDTGDVKKTEAMFNNDNIHKTYGLAVSLVEGMIAKIAAESGVSREMVWQAIIRGKIEGEDLGDADFKELFSEIFTPQFMNNLEKSPIDNEARAIPMIGSLGLGQIDPKLLARIQRRIESYAKIQNEHIKGVSAEKRSPY